MIQKETNLVVADNSGARKVRAFTLYGGSKRKTSYIGDIIKCSVKEAEAELKEEILEAEVKEEPKAEEVEEKPAAGKVEEETKEPEEKEESK